MATGPKLKEMARTDGWDKDGKCRTDNLPTYLFYSEVESELAIVATLVCHQCPVQFSCLMWALDSREHFGVWGGSSERERDRMRRKARRQSRPLEEVAQEFCINPLPIRCVSGKLNAPIRNAMKEILEKDPDALTKVC